MRPHILLHPRLRITLPLCAQRDLRSRLLVRLKTTQTQGVPRPSQRHEPVSLEPKEPTPLTPPPEPDPKYSRPVRSTTIRKGPPARILIYYGGTGRAIYLGMFRVTAIFLFGAACLFIAPAYYKGDYPWYIAPAVIAASALPMIFVTYTSAPYVTFIYLALPAFARRSREAAAQYAKDLPPMAMLHLATTRISTIPRQTAVRFGDLVPDKQLLRPVTFKNLKPARRPWWAGRPPTQFYTMEYSKRGRQTTVFYPELWPFVYRQILNKR